MGNLTSQLTRTCLACGIEKPLSAFLQLSSTHGTNYGNVCSKCRGMGKTGKPVPTSTDDERSTAPSGMGIRGKEKIYADTKREQKIHTLKELYKKEEIKKQDIAEEKTERAGLKEAQEKKHREFYLDSKKQHLLLGKKAQTDQQITARQQDQKIMSGRSATEHHKTTLETKNKERVETIETIAKEETKKTTTSFDYLAHAIAPGRSEMQSVQLQQFFRWLGPAPVIKLLAQGLGADKTNQPQQEANANNKTTEPSKRTR